MDRVRYGGANLKIQLNSKAENPDLDPDPSFQKKAKTLEKIGSYSMVHFGLSSANLSGSGSSLLHM
jgi:hypothetical protein